MLEFPGSSGSIEVYVFFFFFLLFVLLLLLLLSFDRDVIQPGVLQESILSAALRHLALGDTVSQLAWHQAHQTDELQLLTDVMTELYCKLYAIIRQLQVGMEYVVHGSTNQNDNNLKLTLERVCCRVQIQRTPEPGQPTGVTQLKLTGERPWLSG